MLTSMTLATGENGDVDDDDEEEDKYNRSFLFQRFKVLHTSPHPGTIHPNPIHPTYSLRCFDVLLYSQPFTITEL